MSECFFIATYYYITNFVISHIENRYMAKPVSAYIRKCVENLEFPELAKSVVIIYTSILFLCCIFLWPFSRV